MLGRWGDLARGVGDDAAVLDVPAGERLVVSTDASIEDVHFRRGWLSPEEIGWRATTSALSDLAAMAARPLGLVVALAVPDAWRHDVPTLADGIGAAARAGGASIVGGDLTRGRELGITVTVFGSAVTPVGRDGARDGDGVWVTGRLGGPLRALRALLAGAAPGVADRERFARPRARIAEARWLAERGTRALVDVSDGLAADLGHVAAASGVRIVVEGARVPRVPGASLADALASGEEYELALALPANVDEEALAREFAAAYGIALTRVGRVSAPGDSALREAEPRVAVVGDDGDTRVDLPPGHDHFSG